MLQFLGVAQNYNPIIPDNVADPLHRKVWRHLLPLRYNRYRQGTGRDGAAGSLEIERLRELELQKAPYWKRLIGISRTSTPMTKERKNTDFIGIGPQEGR